MKTAEELEAETVRLGKIIAELEAAHEIEKKGYKLLWDENDRLHAAFQLAQKENLRLHEELNELKRKDAP